MKLPFYPFDAELLVGTVVESSPTVLRINLPNAAESSPTSKHGEFYGLGAVGEFVFVEAGEYAILGRIIHVKLPERDRLTVEPKMGKPLPSHPIGMVQLLSSVGLQDGHAVAGVTRFPRIGANVFSANPSLIKYLAECSAGGNDGAVALRIATLASVNRMSVSITPEKLLGRHCGVIGSTGAGKSWTIARLLECLFDSKAKVVLFDATGEYHTLNGPVFNVHLGSGVQPPHDSVEVVVPYHDLSEHMLFSMFRPGTGSQAPKLRQAMKSLKLARLQPALATNGTIYKAGRIRAPFETAYTHHLQEIESEIANFDIEKLVFQIEHECCWPTDRSNPFAWGLRDESALSYCVGLMNRVASMLASPELACIFKPQGKLSIFDALETFFSSPDHRVFRISMRNVPFSFMTREIVANAIAKHLLTKAREGAYLDTPVTVVVDEAHNFLSKKIGDDYSQYSLDAFESIAREGRKFSLTICLATQRPRDLTESVISQLGALIVHRLTNHADREIIEKSASEIDKSAAGFLPTLSPGEAILVGTDFPFPLTIKMDAPTSAPDSRGPDYQKFWANHVETSEEAG